ncbi:ribosome recycling factor [Candidatus Woesebacteria bacterium CG_4_10_14_0_2_um_filter_39_14]|uniref:Ribosome recycling factor n=1 Tax=Candidatus Woesebacteria bacterium CG_4_10_14_0_2_um_filter_39_14 TaxID=1975054 RepID=A0A2M7TN65_9BACT|nr:MAG: ribosome recycling factor [Candidatus Woesebacteria bacterium CG_4_10_14_0_2_um_filter_39_14]
MDETSLRSQMQKVLELVLSDIGTLRTGKAMPSLVENIVCPAYGGTQRLKVQELGIITAPDTQSIVIDPWDKSIIGDIRKGILEANIGLNPSIDGEIIRITLPPMTTEDREKYTKLLSGKLESGRIMVRQQRGEAMKDIKRKFEEKEISEDMKFDQEKKVQEITDEFVGKIDEAGEHKKQELLQI